MYPDVDEFGPNQGIDSAWSRFSITVDVGFPNWPKASISVQMAISGLLLLPLADGHIQPGGRRKKKQALQIPTSGKEEGEDTR